MDTPKKCYLNSKQCTLLRSNLAAQLALTTNRLAHHIHSSFTWQLAELYLTGHVTMSKAGARRWYRLTFNLFISSIFVDVVFRTRFYRSTSLARRPFLNEKGVNHINPVFRMNFNVVGQSLTLLSPVSCPDHFSPSRSEECGLGTRLCCWTEWWHTATKCTMTKILMY